MKMTPKRQRSDSASAAVKAAQAATAGPIKPPPFVNVQNRDVSRWNAIVQARPRDTWTDADLILAAHLARTYGDMAELERLIEERGMITPQGEMNPACNMLDKATRRALAMARQLKVDTISIVGKARDIRPSSELEATARREHEDDELIPRAHH